MELPYSLFRIGEDLQKLNYHQVQLKLLTSTLIVEAIAIDVQNYCACLLKVFYL
ncbi:hypothetical protein [Okeania sp. SIO1F9]|uniref:hypothetical protein n=1 Tax=Okeania sp. SIO1F9 TaxID=2607813 RepID=UPI00144F6B5E|nr:hypothetical protein [Okeania sp. SIO1F9]NET78304.1 hypothetical protein [Okeania sp. SIO1F9]